MTVARRKKPIKTILSNPFERLQNSIKKTNNAILGNSVNGLRSEPRKETKANAKSKTRRQDLVPITPYVQGVVPPRQPPNSSIIDKGKAPMFATLTGSPRGSGPQNINNA